MDVPTFSVPELAAAVRHLLRLGFPDEVWVEGEIGSISRTPSGHVFFDLVEPGPPGSPPVALVPVVLWDDVRREVNAVLRRQGAVRMTEGVRIRIRGRLDLFPRHSRVQLRMSAIDPEHTIGRLAAERDRLVRALADEGLLDRNAQRPLPAVPVRIGLVTSVGSAAHADVVDELARSGLGLTVVVADTAVQGRGAEHRIVAALAALEADDVEVVLVARGGGARTDLAAFDAEVVARAVAGLSVPVLTGVGHEVDVTVIDAVAHRAFKTPTACAAGLVAHVRASLAHLDGLTAAVGRAAPLALGRADERARSAGQHVGRLAGAHLRRAGGHADRRGQAVGRAAGAHLRRGGADAVARADRLRRAADGVLAKAEGAAALAGARVAVADPARALARGWSITRTATGGLVRSPADVGRGEVLVTTVAGGEVRSTVAVTEGGDR